MTALTAIDDETRARAVAATLIVDAAVKVMRTDDTEWHEWGRLLCARYGDPALSADDRVCLFDVIVDAVRMFKAGHGDVDETTLRIRIALGVLFDGRGVVVGDPGPTIVSALGLLDHALEVSS